MQRSGGSDLFGWIVRREETIGEGSVTNKRWETKKNINANNQIYTSLSRKYNIFLLFQSTQKSDIRVISKATIITLSVTHYPLFQWYPQSKEILLNLSMNAGSQHLMHKVRE